MKNKMSLEDDFDSLNHGIDDSLLNLVRQSVATNSDAKIASHANENEADATGARPERPTETLNTRIPKSLDDAIAEWVYQSRKQGQPITKQQLTIDALTHYLDTKLSR